MPRCGFAQAAEATHRSQSSVSYTVARMQEQLGVPLLRIEGRKAVLTEAGEVLLRRSRQLVKQASQLEELARDLERKVAERTAELRQANQRLSLIHGVTNAINSSLDFQRIFEAVVEGTRRLVDFDQVVETAIQRVLDF